MQLQCATLADGEDWDNLIRCDYRLFRQVLSEVAVRARRLMPGTTIAVREAMEFAKHDAAAGVQMLHRAVASEMLLLFGCCTMTHNEELLVDKTASSVDTLCKVSCMVGQVCMQTLHEHVLSQSEASLAAAERQAFVEVHIGSDCLPGTRAWVKEMAMLKRGTSTVQRIAHSLLDMLDRGYFAHAWPETLWLDQEILLALERRLHTDMAMAAVMKATIEEVDKAIAMEEILKTQLVRQVFH